MGCIIPDMSAELEHIKQVVYTFSTKLYAVPEMQPTIDYIWQHEYAPEEVNPFVHIGEMFHGYMGVIDSFANLTDADIAAIAHANILAEARGIVHNSASHYDAVTVHRVLQEEQRKGLAGNMQEAICMGSDVSVRALIDLTDRMIRGHEYAEELKLTGGSPSDQDPRTHTMIFGHTRSDWNREKSPYALVHFALSHDLDRLFDAMFSTDDNPELGAIAGTKDTFIDVMSTTIRLRQAQGLIFPVISAMYALSRPEGGLGWGKPARQQTYYEAVAAQQN